jgi:hypothetical protein
MLRSALFVVCLAPLSGCLNVTVQPIDVRVHATLGVNVKVDRALDDFFGDLDKKSATINPPAVK